MVLKVAIVGAGVSGLASIKCCLNEGLEPICFEKTGGIGGLWKFTEIPERRRITVYRSVITNTSKEMTCFSDFPFPEDCPNYLHHSVLLKYLGAYAEHFQLLDYIHFKTTVYSIRKHPDFTSTGQWVVHTETGGQQASDIFDAVMICSGRYAEPNLPLDSFPGIENFKGRYLHSWEYRDQKEFEGKNVLVIGAGNTGGDIASEVCRTAAKVFLSTRSGTWVLSRLAESGWPSDMVLGTRLMTYIQWLFPGCILRRMKAKIFNRWFNHENYGLVPIQSSWTPVILNDELPSCILSGAIVVKPNVKEFTETSVIFEDGTMENHIDVIIFTTGSCKLPPVSRLMSEVAKKKKTLLKMGFPIEKDSIKTSFVAYMDEIAACAGVKPNLLLLFLLDPKLAWKILCGPCTSYQYRLTGPGKWKKARSAILTEWDRVLKPLKTRATNHSPTHSMASFWFKVLGCSFLGTALVILKFSSLSWLPRLK
ncbi:dimethylaniline monooxygenase [N-oxide-forming] 4 isoform X2 [Sceloporus undulatus]|uniref:dimethylaniline monooxygenase [N-oxide-forming] 4 isoform X2 n=1 Tax=Sceloporus undulatus TaxID=8520 RepID=UPI001C4AF304|nr:dimethylaniline monooxygenase [N-oxide-forming] 4 isoform X2 [Sceloporus undulatus]